MKPQVYKSFVAWRKQPGPIVALFEKVSGSDVPVQLTRDQIDTALACRNDYHPQDIKLFEEAARQHLKF